MLEVKSQGKNVFTNGLVLPDLSLFNNISYGSSFCGFVAKRELFVVILMKKLKVAVFICQTEPYLCVRASVCVCVCVRACIFVTDEDIHLYNDIGKT